jgi:hypothetical protein
MLCNTTFIIDRLEVKFEVFTVTEFFDNSWAINHVIMEPLGSTKGSTNAYQQHTFLHVQRH